METSCLCITTYMSTLSQSNSINVGFIFRPFFRFISLLKLDQAILTKWMWVIIPQLGCYLFQFPSPLASVRRKFLRIGGFIVSRKYCKVLWSIVSGKFLRIGGFIVSSFSSDPHTLARANLQIVPKGRNWSKFRLTTNN